MRCFMWTERRSLVWWVGAGMAIATGFWGGCGGGEVMSPSGGGPACPAMPDLAPAPPRERVAVMPRKRAKKLRERIVETTAATTETYP